MVSSHLQHALRVIAWARILRPTRISRFTRITTHRDRSPLLCASAAKVHNKDELENYGYSRRPESAHIQRAIDDREKAMYEHRRYGSKAPPTAHMRLPLGPHGAAGSQQFQAYKAETANPGSILRPASAPAKSGGAKKK